MKKSVWLSAIFIVGVVSGYYVLEKLPERVEKELAARQIQLSPKDIHLSFFPPKVSVEKLQYIIPDKKSTGVLQVPKAQIDFNYSALFSHQPIIKELTLKNGVFFLYSPKLKQSEVILNKINAKVEPQTEWKVLKVQAQAEDISQNKFSLTGDLLPVENSIGFKQVKGIVKLDKSVLFPQKTVTVEIKQGQFDYNPNQHLVLNQIKINQASIAQFELTGKNNSYNFNLKINSKENLAGTALKQKINGQDQWKVGLNSSYFNTDTFSQLLGRESWVNGIFSLNGSAIWQDDQAKYAAINIDSLSAGKLNNIALLPLLEKYIQLPKDKVNKYRNVTAYDSLKVNTVWQDNHFNLNNFQLSVAKINLNGHGIIEPNKQNCDFLLKTSSDDPRYKAIVLSLHMFGNCRSPQYKIDLNDTIKQNLRSRLQDFLRKL